MNGVTRYNVYDQGGKLVHVEELDNPNIEGDQSSQTDYLNAAGMTIARIKNSATENGVFNYLHPDHLGSPVAGTSEDAIVTLTERFTPFGETLINPAANNNQSGFTGHIKDADIGLNYMQARYYDPNSARFLSVDPEGFMESGNPRIFNRYGYAFNDPTNMIDPDGEFPIIIEQVKIVKAQVETRAIFATEYVSLKTESIVRNNILTPGPEGDETFVAGDQQAHFVANAKASAKSPLHQAVAKGISDKREAKQLVEDPTQTGVDAGELDTAANDAGQKFGEAMRNSDTKLSNKAVKMISRAAGEAHAKTVNPKFKDRIRERLDE